MRMHINRGHVHGHVLRIDRRRRGSQAEQRRRGQQSPAIQPAPHRLCVTQAPDAIDVVKRPLQHHRATAEFRCRGHMHARACRAGQAARTAGRLRDHHPAARQVGGAKPSLQPNSLAGERRGVTGCESVPTEFHRTDLLPRLRAGALTIGHTTFERRVRVGPRAYCGSMRDGYGGRSAIGHADVNVRYIIVLIARSGHSASGQEGLPKPRLTAASRRFETFQNQCDRRLVCTGPARHIKGSCAGKKG